MKPKNYKELHQRHVRAGSYSEITPTEKIDVLAQWDADTIPARWDEKRGPGRHAREITTILESEGVDIKDIPPVKLATYLNGSLRFNQLIAILGRSIPDAERAFKTGEALFHVFGREAPLSAADYAQLNETQRRLMPEILKEDETGFAAKEWLKGKLRPLITRPLMMSLQQHAEDVRRLNDEAYRKQNFLDDGVTPAGVQHILEQRRKSGATISGMIDTPGGSEDVKPFAQIKNKLLSLQKDDADFPQYEVMLRDIVGSKTQIDLKVPGARSYPLDVRKEKNTDGTITLRFRGEKIVFSKNEHSKLLELLGLPPLTDAVENKEAAFAAALDKAVKALSKNASVEKELRDLFVNTGTSDSQRDAFSRGIKEAKDGFVHILTTGEPLTDSDFSILKKVLENGAALPESAPRIEHLAYRAFSAIAQAYRELHEPKDSRLDSLAYATPLDAEKKDDEATKYRPGLIKKILHDGKKYKNIHEKKSADEFLKLTDGEGKVWNSFTFTISTDATSGTKTYTYADRKTSAERTFVLSADEQKKLSETGVESDTNPEAEVERIKLALAEVKKRLETIERDASATGLPDDKKRKHIYFINSLLADGATFAGAYYTPPPAGTGAPKKGKVRDIRHDVSLWKSVTAGEVTLSGEPIEGFAGTIPGMMIKKDKLLDLKAKLEGTAAAPKMPEGFGAALSALNSAEEGKPFGGTPEQRALLDKWAAEAAKADGVVDGGFHKKTIGSGDDRVYNFSGNASGAPIIFTINQIQINKWNRIKIIIKTDRTDHTGGGSGGGEVSVPESFNNKDNLDEYLIKKLVAGSGLEYSARKADGSIDVEKLASAKGWVEGLKKKRWMIFAGVGALIAGAAALTGFGLAGALLYSGLIKTGGAFWATKILTGIGAGIAYQQLGLGNWLGNKMVWKGFLDGKKYKGVPKIPWHEVLNRTYGHGKAMKAFLKEQDVRNHNVAISERNVRGGGIAGLTYDASKWKVSREFIEKSYEKGQREGKWWGVGWRILGGSFVGGAIGAGAYQSGLLPAFPTWSSGQRTAPPTLRGGPPPGLRSGGPAFVQPNGPRNIGTITRPIWVITDPGDVRFINDCPGFRGIRTEGIISNWNGFPRNANYHTVEHAFRGIFRTLNGVEIRPGSRTAQVLDMTLRRTVFDSPNDLQNLLGYRPQGGPRVTDGIRDYEWVTRRLQSGQPLNFRFLQGNIDEMIARAQTMSGSEEAVRLLQQLKANIQTNRGMNLTAYINRR